MVGESSRTRFGRVDVVKASIEYDKTGSARESFLLIDRIWFGRSDVE